jgi:predicted nuclease of restriction endonuclease-like (RecB) superfamily
MGAVLTESVALMADIIPPEDTVYQRIRTVLAAARQKAYTAVNVAMVEAYWDIGRQIMDAQNGQRAEYGAGLLKYLAERLTKEFGKGFTVTNLKYMRQFYTAFPISHTLCDQLSWSHYRLLMKIDDTARRGFYQKECADKNETMAKYSVLSDKDNLFASKYMLFIPTEEELKKELEHERLLIESRLIENNNG